MVLERCTLRFAKLTENAFAPVKMFVVQFSCCYTKHFLFTFVLKDERISLRSRFRFEKVQLPLQQPTRFLIVLTDDDHFISVPMNTKFLLVENKSSSPIFKLNYRLVVMVVSLHAPVWLQRISSTLELVLLTKITEAMWEL